MLHKISKLSFALATLFASASLFATEYQYSHGTLKMEGGFIGLNSELSTDISTHTITEKHKNIFSSTWYYHYDLTWYDSDKMLNAQQDFNSITTLPLGYNPAKAIPAINYRYEGLDANVVLGKDLYHKDKRTFFGLGLALGISLPWVETGKDSSNDDTTSDDTMDLMKKSKTKMLTYKVGLSVNTSYAFSKYVMAYFNGMYAYQTGTMKNDYVDSELDVDGIFQQYDAGIKLQPFAEDFKTKYLTLSPRLYASLGYRYVSWELKDVAFDVTGAGVKLPKGDFDSKTSSFYFGIGYDFF